MWCLLAALMRNGGHGFSHGGDLSNARRGGTVAH
jgi:hypothetical protein